MTNPGSDKIERVSVPALDEVLGRQWKVLDDGFVRVVDYLGSDAAIVQAARVSYGVGTKTVHEDSGLIRYLMRHRHTTPFEMCELKLHVRVPMDTWRQWIRHRTANVNEYSTRYSVAIDAAAQTSPNAWRIQAKGRKQGSDGLLDASTGADLSRREEALQEEARRVYEERLAEGVAREQARKDLPLSTYTEAYWKIDLHNLLHFLLLRMDAHAQAEIREYANVIGNEIVARWCPVTWKAFCDYQLRSLLLTAHEVELIQKLSSETVEEAMKLCDRFGWLQRNESGEIRANRERQEAEEKLERLGLSVPWRESTKEG